MKVKIELKDLSRLFELWMELSGQGEDDPDLAERVYALLATARDAE